VWVDWLNVRGYTAVHWSSIGSPCASDRTVLAWTAEHDHVLFTHDLGFGAILASSSFKGPSVLQVRARDVTPEGVGTSVLEALAQHQSSLWQGALVTVDDETMRVRLLPLR
jgi:predicted nuclease of predicted toxin-antitoxin system